MAKGDELLIVDGSERHRAALVKILEEEGYVCSVAATDAEARESVSSKSFPVILVDIDLGGTASGGLDLIRYIREASPASDVIGTLSRRGFEAAVHAFRLGCIDVIVKASDQMNHLKQTIAASCTRYRLGGGSPDLLVEVRTVLNDAFNTMLSLARKVYDEVSVAAMVNFRPRILFIESDQQMVRQLGALVQNKNWEIEAAINGGDGLDKSARRFDLVVVRDELPDLRGTMVISTIQTHEPTVLGMLYNAPGENGAITHYNMGRVGDVHRPFTDPAQLIEQIDQVVATLGFRQREQMVIRAFRNDHEELFVRLAELKLRIDKAIG